MLFPAHEHDEVRGSSMARPQPVSNRLFSQTLASALHRPHLFYRASPGASTADGRGSGSAARRHGQRPAARLQEAGFHFTYPALPRPSATCCKPRAEAIIRKIPTEGRDFVLEHLARGSQSSHCPRPLNRSLRVPASNWRRSADRPGSPTGLPAGSEPRWPSGTATGHRTATTADQGQSSRHRGGAQPPECRRSLHQLQRSIFSGQFAAGPRVRISRQLAAPGGHAGLGLGPAAPAGRPPSPAPASAPTPGSPDSGPGLAAYRILPRRWGATVGWRRMISTSALSLWRQAIAAKARSGKKGASVRQKIIAKFGRMLSPPVDLRLVTPGLEAAPLYG